MAFKRSSNSAGGLQATFDAGTPAQKAAFQASVSGDTIPRFRQPPALAVLGDSRAFNHLGGPGRDLSSRGPVVWAVNKLSGRATLDYRDVFGIGGTQIAVDNGAGASARTRLPALLAATSAAIIVVIADLNDIVAGRTAMQMATDMQGLCEGIIAAGRIPLLLGCVITQYSTTSTARTLVAEYNRRMRQYAAATRRMIWVDASTAVTDFASATTAAVAPGSGASAYYFDAIHYGPRAAEIIGNAIAAALDQYLPEAPWIGMWDAEDAYHATDRPFGSLIGIAGRLALAGGGLVDRGNTASSAATGVCASSCRLYKDAGQAISVTGSLVSETINYAGRTFAVPAQRIQIAAGGTGQQTAHLQLPDITASQVAVGESYVLSSYIRIANSAGLYSVNLQTRERGAASEQVQQCGNMTATTNAGAWSYWENTARAGAWISTSKLMASPLWNRAHNFIDIQVDGALASVDLYVAQVVARKIA